ncbi:hypothetical protein WGC32_00695 [Zongyangia sp. HA2173]|uniref:hypothetical protein n=1 Tax=Zongyangia sp. HA2173 TaxID=3133035 RepID=UPI003168073A
MERKCWECQYFYADDRGSAYRRPPCFFCRRKGGFYSRNYKIGEKTRIGREDPACPDFQFRKDPQER